MMGSVSTLRAFASYNDVFYLVIQRLALGVVTLFLVAVLVFAATEILPGDVATSLLGNQATPEAVEAIRLSLRLDEPVVYRFFYWLNGLLHFDLGTSLSNGRSVLDQISFRLENTLFLAGCVAVIAVPLAVTLGAISVIAEDRFFDRLINAAALSAISMPQFLIGYALILVFAVHLGWFPSLSLMSQDGSLWEKLYVIVLPGITLIVVVLAHMIRMTRAALIGVMSQSFIEMAFLKGVSRWRIVVQHALPVAAAPIVNVIALNLAYLIVGVVVVEVVFVYPGIGQLMVDAVSRRDVPVVQACGLIFSGTFTGLNLIADIVAIMVNPRLRHSQ